MIDNLNQDFTRIEEFPVHTDYQGNWENYSLEMMNKLKQMPNLSREMISFIAKIETMIEQFNTSNTAISETEENVTQLKQDTQAIKESAITEVAENKESAITGITELKNNSLTSIGNLTTDSIVNIEEKRDLSLQELDNIKTQTNTIKEQTLEVKEETESIKETARKWATEAEDVEVFEGLYSAMHYSLKAAATVAAIPAGAVTDIEIALDKVWSSFKTKQQLDLKADKTDTYIKEEIDTKIEKKQNKYLFEKSLFGGL